MDFRSEEARQQDAGELADFLELIEREGVRSYLEVGSKWGGTLWAVGSRLPVPSKIVCVDLPWGDQRTKGPLTESVNALRKLGHDVSLFLDDSTKADVVEAVRRHGPFDLAFVDANHTLDFVTVDWKNYGPMCRMVAFHDVGWSRKVAPGRMPIEVPILWERIKVGRRFVEIRRCADENGIGVIWNEES